MTIVHLINNSKLLTITMRKIVSNYFERESKIFMLSTHLVMKNCIIANSPNSSTNYSHFDKVFLFSETLAFSEDKSSKTV